jgi:hypothetical protein
LGLHGVLGSTEKAWTRECCFIQRKKSSTCPLAVYRARVLLRRCPTRHILNDLRAGWRAERRNFCRTSRFWRRHDLGRINQG